MDNSRLESSLPGTAERAVCGVLAPRFRKGLRLCGWSANALRADSLRPGPLQVRLAFSSCRDGRPVARALLERMVRTLRRAASGRNAGIRAGHGFPRSHSVAAAEGSE